VKIGVNPLKRGTILRQSRSPCSVLTGATVVAPKTEEYRANARECEQLAEQTRDAYLKEQFLKTAEQWRTMAAYEEKHGR
jgi:hypothetical protein